ncbi:TauD/TfdA family dioxygenase [Pseudomonas sp. BCRC 81390]|uniref:TauD/TfdA family dioxygenase n=1 Tax=Pseudomonas sp. BCRC 81390 TaxID=3054778 RepID=UPI0025988597|nr:TauD/TfdA family dioxygenase [Pseudomonas sp. BCRC 81390]MDM3884353.1 TauD/TfdA family dioxygenase [Pseudomonas sp. BCRC 81390]
MAGIELNKAPQILKFQFTEHQSRLLDFGSKQTAAVGGPDVAGAAAIASHHAKILKGAMNERQIDMLRCFYCGEASAVEFVAMQALSSDPAPECLLTIEALITDPVTLYLASRNQILLNLVDYRSFAFDIDNDSRQVRLVGNFKGGGKNLLHAEPTNQKVELSSHSGLKLGPHTEPPYNCSVKSESAHSPAPSALILTARWNPLHEPTTLIPVRDVVTRLNGLEALALSSNSFSFTRSDCFIKDESQKMVEKSILQFDPNSGFTLRFSSYRHAPTDGASPLARQAFHSLLRLLNEAKPYTFPLHSGSAILINNSQTLHARETIKDNRRLLVRLFGYSPDAQPLVIQQDPLVVRG